MAFRIDDPFFDQPGLDYLRPVTTWTEVSDDLAEVDVALIVVQYQPRSQGRTIRAEVTRSPAYIRAHYGRMFDPDRIVDMVEGGHKVTVERFVVRGGVLDVIDDTSPNESDIAEETI